MNVKTYSLASDGKTKLAPNFSVAEFRCKDGSDKILISDDLVKVLQAIRDHFAAPVRITSGYRTPAYNRRVGGVSNSQHVLGTAADINVDSQTPVQLCRAIVNGWIPGVPDERMGVGLYKTFVHVDVRGHKARWTGTGIAGVEEEA